MDFKSDKEFYLLNLGQKSEHRVKYHLVRVLFGGGGRGAGLSHITENGA